MPGKPWFSRSRSYGHGPSSRGSHRWHPGRGRQTRGPSESNTRHPGRGRTWQQSSQSRRERSESTASATFHSATPSNIENVDIESEDYLDSLNEVIMAVNMRDRETIGCAYYVAQTETLYFMEDMKFGSVEIFDSLKLFIHPTMILVPNRLDETAMNILDPDGRNRRSDDGASDHFSLPYVLDPRPTSEFSYDAAKSKLVSLRIGSQQGPKVTIVFPGDVSAREPWEMATEDDPEGSQSVMLKLAGWVNVESSITVGCSGSILAYIQRRRASRYLPSDDNAENLLRVSTLAMFSLENIMFINSDTLLSLQIMQLESSRHARNQAPAKAKAASRGELSVFGLFSKFAATPQGKHLLRQYFVRPSLSILLIEQRLDAISVLMQPDNDLPVKAIAKLLRSVANMRPVLVSLRKGMTGGSGKAGTIACRTWTKFRRFCFAVITIREELLNINGHENVALFAKTQHVIDVPQLEQIGVLINSIVDFDDSQIEERTVVRPNIDRQLDELKHRYAGIPDLLTKTAREIGETIPQNRKCNLNVVFFPQIGYLISMPLESVTGGASWASEEQPSWERLFSSDIVAYYKNERMKQMDEELGDLWTDICDLETEIIFNLAQQVLHFEEMLSSVSDICGELDCLLSLALGAKQNQLVRPRVVEDNVIDIKGGRHILQALANPSFIPNDLVVAGRTTSEGKRVDSPPAMIMMTGPNNSGKSVYLKQNAIIVYMAHIGSFVPAASATIGITDKILTRIATRETVSRTQSAFMIDLQQISIALHLATNRSLLLIDEFGKGTNASDGAGLACSVFEHLLSLGSSCPKVLAATHYHEIFEDGLLKEQPGLMFAYAEILVDTSAEETENQLTYLYSVKQGRSTKSFGTICAALNGIPPEVIGRADELALLASKGEDLATVCTVMPHEEETQLEEAVELHIKILEIQVINTNGQ